MARSIVIGELKKVGGAYHPSILCNIYRFNTFCSLVSCDGGGEKCFLCDHSHHWLCYCYSVISPQQDKDDTHFVVFTNASLSRKIHLFVAVKTSQVLLLWMCLNAYTEHISLNQLIFCRAQRVCECICTQPPPSKPLHADCSLNYDSEKLWPSRSHLYS